MDDIDIDLTLDNADWVVVQSRGLLDRVRGQKLRVDQIYRLTELRGRLTRANREMDQLLEEGGYACR